MTLRGIPEHALDPHVRVEAKTGLHFCPSCGQPVGQHLTPRECEVLALIATGMRNPEIATVLMVTPGTVKAHVKKIYRVLHARDRVSALLNASALGLIVIEHPNPPPKGD